MPFSESKKQEIANALSRKGATKSCGRCGGNSFTLLDDYFRLEAQENLKNVVMGGPSIPAYGVACENCGDISLHAVKIVTPNAF